MPVPLAPRDEAIEIVREIEAAFARLSVLEKEYERALALLDHLDAAVLAKAFRGELVPQDASYEPASVLLERIRAERESLVSAPRQRRVKEQVKTSGSSSKRGKVMPKKRSNVGVSHLSELLMRMGGSAGSQELWRQSDMDLDEFYKLLRDEVKAGRIVECADKERLEVRDAA